MIFRYVVRELAGGEAIQRFLLEFDFRVVQLLRQLFRLFLLCRHLDEFIVPPCIMHILTAASCNRILLRRATLKQPLTMWKVKTVPEDELLQTRLTGKVDRTTRFGARLLLTSCTIRNTASDFDVSRTVGAASLDLTKLSPRPVIFFFFWHLVR